MGLDVSYSDSPITGEYRLAGRRDAAGLLSFSSGLMATSVSAPPSRTKRGLTLSTRTSARI
jgi:hypothetical protein